MFNYSRFIDHTLLKANATKAQVFEICEEARKYGFASVCINPCYVSAAAGALKESGVKICTVVGFPLGATTPEVKAFETEQAVKNGAQEIDMVINIGALKSGGIDIVEKEIAQVVKAAAGAVVKVIIETCFLTDAQKEQACMAAMKAGAHFVKTSTGYGTSGATVEDIKLLKSIVGDRMGVKASGGIRDADTALRLIEAGADRIGTSSGVDICEGKQEMID